MEVGEEFEILGTGYHPHNSVFSGKPLSPSSQWVHKELAAVCGDGRGGAASHNGYFKGVLANPEIKKSILLSSELLLFCHHERVYTCNKLKCWNAFM